jgi:nucleotide-binding universal stress UspA family protein
MFVPPASKPGKFETIFVAWKNTREAARAVAEAMPFLQRASQVIVGLVEEEGASEQFGIEPGADIGRYLSRHGVAAEIRPINGWVYAGEALLNEAQRTGAQMIVMGGYGHSRFREWVLGGATRHLLTHAGVPVLMAH